MLNSLAPEVGKVGMIGKAIHKFQCREPFDTGRPVAQTRSPKVVVSSDSCCRPVTQERLSKYGGQDVFWNNYCLPEDYIESEQIGKHSENRRGKSAVRYPAQTNSLA